MGPLPAVLLVALLAAPEASPLPRRAADPLGWFAGDVFYEIYVRSFADSDGDGHGDLRGVIARLDDLKALGIDGLWLMPIYDGPTEHGYAITNYDAIEPRYGTMQDALQLIEEAHRRGLAVLFDYVPNHVSIEHPWFVAADNGDLQAQDHFVFADEPQEGWTVPWDPGDKRPVWSRSAKLGRWYYHAFHPSMPDLNLEDRPTRASMMRAARSWIERGVDGLRIDAARYLYEGGPRAQADQPKSVQFIADLATLLAPHGPLIVAEAWTNSARAARYLGTKHAAASMVFDFDRALAMHRAIGDGAAADLEAVVRRSEALPRPGGRFGVFATNHDCPAPRPGNRGPDAAVLANALVLLGGGVPFLWQGDELGLKAIDEQQIRRPMRWAPGAGAGFTTGKPWREIGGRFAGDDFATQAADPGSVWRQTQALLQVRRRSEALRFGLRHPVEVRGSSSLWAFIRHSGTDRVLVVANLAAREATGKLDLTALRSGKRAKLPPLFGAAAPLTVNKGRASVRVGPRGVVVFQIPRTRPGFDVTIARPGAALAVIDAVDQGLMINADRSLGFSRDVSRSLRCSKPRRRGAQRCSVRLQSASSYDMDELRWMARLPPGPYQVEVHVGSGGRPALRIEGELMRGRGKVLSSQVMVRDGLLTLRPVPADAGGSPVDITRVVVRQARYRKIRQDVEVAGDRLVVRAPSKGTVEWRIDDSEVEPVERTPLKRRRGSWVATLGPWPVGAVRQVSWIIRSPRGEFLTAADGQELQTRIAAD